VLQLITKVQINQDIKRWKSGPMLQVVMKRDVSSAERTSATEYGISSWCIRSKSCGLQLKTWTRLVRPRPLPRCCMMEIQLLNGRGESCSMVGGRILVLGRFRAWTDNGSLAVVWKLLESRRTT
jgi:hypothetical protein